MFEGSSAACSKWSSDYQDVQGHTLQPDGRVNIEAVRISEPTFRHDRRCLMPA